MEGGAETAAGKGLVGGEVRPEVFDELAADLAAQEGTGIVPGLHPAMIASVGAAGVLLVLLTLMAVLGRAL